MTGSEAEDQGLMGWVRPTCDATAHPHLLAVSDLHVQHPQDVDVAAALWPRHPGDWLLVAGDVAERSERVLTTPASLAERFAQVVWTPGNHELWTHPKDPDTRRGVARYEHLVEVCRAHGVRTPEDPYAVWPSPDGPLVVVPAFLLYDYSFREPDLDQHKALRRAHEAGHVLLDEYLLHPEPFADVPTWCRERVSVTEARLAALPEEFSIVLVSHYPLVEAPTHQLFSPHLALWSGSRLTAQWHRRYPIRTAVYGHLHIPRSTVVDGVAFEEVSLGYPHEHRRHRHLFAPRVLACGTTQEDGDS